MNKVENNEKFMFFSSAYLVNTVTIKCCIFTFINFYSFSYQKLDI